MCVFNNYILMQEELKELQKDARTASRNYDDELRLFQKKSVIDSFNAEKVKAKYDAYQESKEKILRKQEEIQFVQQQIADYLTAMNGMAIRHKHSRGEVEETLIFEMETNDYGEKNLVIAKED